MKKINRAFLTVTTLVGALSVAACASDEPLKVGAPQVDPNNPCFSNIPYTMKVNGVQAAGYKRQYAGKSCGDSQEKQLMITKSFELLTPRLKEEINNPALEPRAMREIQAVMRDAYAAGDLGLKRIKEQVEANGLKWEHFNLPFLQDYLTSLAGRTINSKDGIYNEIARLEWQDLWENGRIDWGFPREKIQPQIIAALAKHAVLNCFTGVEGGVLKVEGFKATIEEILEGRSPLAKYGRVAENRGGVLWCVKPSEAKGSAPKISLLLTPHQTEEMINHSVAANLAAGWQPGEEFALNFG